MRHPTPEEEAALRVHLGDARYRRMHEMALTRGAGVRGPRELRGNVILIHGIMGGELAALRDGRSTDIWAKVFRLIGGGIAQLRLAASGREEATPGCTIEATGIMKKHYGEMLLSLGVQWKVRAFWYDWRRDLDTAASLLAARATEWFGKGAPFHIVAHSMGGLVARTFILRNRDWWDGMTDGDADLVRGGRLVMLGTPNHGSFAIPQIMTGLEGMVRKLALVDLRHSRDDVVEIVNSFPGSYQMMPSPLIEPGWKALYDARNYAPFRVSQMHLDAATAHHEALSDIIDPARMIYIAGANQPTWAGVDTARLTDRSAYTATFEGDGRVPHRLGLLKGVPTWYVEEDHGALARNRDVLATIDELLERGKTGGLMASPPATRAGADAALRQLEEREDNDRREIEAYLHRTRTTRTMEAPATDYISADERLVEDLLTRGFLSAPDEEEAAPPPPKKRAATRPRLDLALVAGGIQDAGEDDGELPVDAIAVGHYRDVKPTAAELAVDRAISAALLGKSPGSSVPEKDLLITQLTERGTIPAGLGQPFILRDPRTVTSGGARRAIVLAGMGTPGGFGAPELAVLVRELVWAMGRMGHRHLASVLIGSGNGNLTIPVAVKTWIQGLCTGLVGESPERRIDRLTFVEFDPERVLEIDDAIVEAAERVRDTLLIRYSRLTAEQRQDLAQRARRRDLDEAKRRVEELRTGGASTGRRKRQGAPLPTRVAFTLDGSSYRMGAITADAAIPERDVTLDPKLVAQANDELAGERRLEGQLDRGRFLERLIIPRELRGNLASSAPLVLMLDATTARIHWEMVAQPQVTDNIAPPSRTDEFASHFLGTARGLTRQLRTSFAPPPEPPPPPRRTLRILVVADPAADAHLPGAEEEGIAVARLFESFNRLYQSDENRVEVVRLFGPSEATRTNVLRTIMSQSFDVLHYCGHCRYDPKDASRSGWIFTRDEVLSAHELNRIDRIPKFVFSNACESGITPDRSEKRTVDLAPGFAEAFFARGVANFVCTAWPVDDLAARVFALELYGRLLGLVPGIPKDNPDGAARPEIRKEGPTYMHEAMYEARLAIMGTPNGLRTWGAYQHYGNPHFRLFDADALTGKR